MSMVGVFGSGGAELALIVTVCLILLIVKPLPNMARGFSEGLRQFQRATRELLGEAAEPLHVEHSRQPLGPPVLIALTGLLGVCCLLLVLYELSR